MSSPLCCAGELLLYTNNCRTVGTVSALMAGIAYSALIYTKMAYFQESPIVQQILYITGLVVCMCLSLRNVFGTTLLTMLGPGKALRGPDGSMHSAVDGMLDCFEGIVIVQHLTIYSFMLTAIVYFWGAASMSAISSTMLSVLVGSVTYTMYVRTRVVEHSFPLRKIPLVSGAFFPKASEQQAQSQATAAAAAGAATEAMHLQQLAPDGGEQQQRAGQAQMEQRMAGSLGPITHQEQPPPAFPGRGAGAGAAPSRRPHNPAELM